MAIGAFARAMLTHEARALLARLALIKPFALQEPMLPAAALLPDALGRDRPLPGRGPARAAPADPRLPRLAAAPHGERATDEEAQRRFAILRLKFNVALIQFDTVRRRHHATQRERDRRVAVRPRRGRRRRAGAARLLRGAAGHLLPRPRHRRRDPARAHAHAGRRREPGRDHPRAARAHGRHRHRVVAGARGRAPGGGAARPRRIRCGRRCARLQRGAAPAPLAWQLWERWISEIVADFWSVARVGIAATLGLMAVVSLPRAFVFRLNIERSAPDALDPRQAQRGDRRGALSASAMAAAERRRGNGSTRVTT